MVVDGRISSLRSFPCKISSPSSSLLVSLEPSVSTSFSSDTSSACSPSEVAVSAFSLPSFSPSVSGCFDSSSDVFSPDSSVPSVFLPSSSFPPSSPLSICARIASASIVSTFCLICPRLCIFAPDRSAKDSISPILSFNPSISLVKFSNASSRFLVTFERPTNGFICSDTIS